MALLDSIRTPEDLRTLPDSALEPLAAEMRDLIVRTVRSNGGHMASNLGVVELTIALHRSFSSPGDAIVWDVGHQCYAHKILTGRAGGFPALRRKGGLSGFPKRSESAHDLFDTGHASTSISSALGLLEARRAAGKEGKVIAVIGDGALTGGMAFEGLSHAGHLQHPLVVVLNDNKMSISPNVGALARYLSRLAASWRYQKFRAWFDSGVRTIPRVGEGMLDLVVRAKRAVKAVLFRENLFADLGFEYMGPLDGHDIAQMTRAFKLVRGLDRPVVVHVITRKGKGFDLAEEDPENFHGVAPVAAPAPVAAASVRAATSAVAQGNAGVPPAGTAATFTEAFGAAILDLAVKDSRVVAITAAMSRGTGLEPMRSAMPGRVYDVGIAEQHAVTFAAGLAAGGMRPVVAIYSTFLQRAADQVFHDVALPGLPVVFAVDRSGFVGDDGETHQGLYDLAMFRCMPNMTILAPSDSGELCLFLERALASDGPTMIRYPKAKSPRALESGLAPLEPGAGVWVERRPGARMLACALGPLAPVAAEAARMLSRKGVAVDVYSLRHAAPLDRERLRSICAGYEAIGVLEEGSVVGGVGEAIAALLSDLSPRARVAVRGIDPLPPSQASRDELLADAGLDAAGIGAFLSDLA